MVYEEKEKPNISKDRIMPPPAPAGKNKKINESMKKSNEEISIDEVVEMIIDGFTYRKIAEELNISLRKLTDFIALPEQYARARLALETSAQTFAGKAEEILINAEASSIEIQRARELAQHYRWMASKRNPKTYGEKIIQDITLTKVGKDLEDETYE